jgi:hypothetical protein
MTYKSKAIVSRSLYQVFVASLCGLVVWGAFSVYQILTLPAEVSVESKVLAPITVGLDEGVIDVLMKRRLVSTDISILPKPSGPPIESAPVVEIIASPSGDVVSE